MLFNSLEFIFLFLPITFCGFFFLGHTGRRDLATFWLVAASFFFYGYWDIHYVPLLFASITWNFLVGSRIEQGTHKRACLITGIVGNILLLGYYKYMGFFMESVNSVMGTPFFEIPTIILPLGISFFTFTQTAFLVDAYRKETRNTSFLTYCEFVTIFPHLIAGPIISHKKMIPQFNDPKNFIMQPENIALGTALFVMGLAKKVMIADTLSPWVAKAFSHADTLSLLEAWAGALAYTFQLYFDFSAYSEMAIGLALLFNLKFPVNFNSPYKSLSIIDFWRRWHMTLGTWVRDYLYIPMGGNRGGELMKMRNLFLSMLIMGLWHGAGWTFVLWGGIHGLCLMVNHQWRRLGIALPRFLSWGLTFLCVNFAWVLFRAENLEQGANIIRSMVGPDAFSLPAGGVIERRLGFLSLHGIPFESWQSGISLFDILPVLVVSSVLLTLPNPLQMLETRYFLTHRKAVAFLLGLILGFTILDIIGAGESEFLYFQF